MSVSCAKQARYIKMETITQHSENAHKLHVVGHEHQHLQLVYLVSTGGRKYHIVELVPRLKAA